MSDKEGKTFAFPLLNGNYKTTGNWYSFLVVNGAKGNLKQPIGTELQADIKLGDFGDADPEVMKVTGQKFYNFQITYWVGQEVIEKGVLSADGLNITTKGLMGVCEMEWVTEVEAAALEAEGDPIEAPPGDYKIQPEYQGKLLWITGAPGLGKSTSAQLLARNQGYVYYEVDCFGNMKNPYIPKDEENPSIAQFRQKALKGEGLEKRKEVRKRSINAFREVLSGKKFNVEDFKEYYSCMCDDIISERKRIGGDWAVAGVAFTRGMRDHIR